MYLTTKEAAALCNMSTHKFSNLAQAYNLIPTKRTRGSNAWWISDVRSLMKTFRKDTRQARRPQLLVEV